MYNVVTKSKHAAVRAIIRHSNNIPVYLKINCSSAGFFTCAWYISLSSVSSMGLHVGRIVRVNSETYPPTDYTYAWFFRLALIVLGFHGKICLYRILKNTCIYNA